MLNRSQLYDKAIKCKKKNSAVASPPKEHLYKQMTPNPAFTERNIQKANTLYFLHSCLEKNSDYTLSSLDVVFGLSTL